MNILSIAGGAISSLFGIGTEWVKASQQRKTAKLEHQLALERAKTESQVKKIQTSQEADIAWEQTSLDQAGWKDEFLLLLYSIPLVLCFLPEYSQYVERGFAILDQTPDWYQYSLGLMVASSYGHKKFLKHMNIKKGSK
jgi:hypothetical protein